ncbi:hypothetical protein [Streptomyces sp. VRA16 Mangrove soil]|uniref:hypothetical protein n=1 Tax=Streptomyces sp. VRA16 Mangrove soil TaxID=2817434 RepID=UPI001A9D6056|nr:hypothetical protein [Streptomyces sp. VRA16 Mangrove soil]MBO1331051.1 hypothetical protein [Streptomyces sp. VRA16 Mangrove soil]
MSDDAFLVTVVGTTHPHPLGPEPTDRDRTAGPATARNRQGDDIAGLGFDFGSHDSVLSLWAVSPHSGQRHHIMDARGFTRDQWDELGRCASALTGGRLTVDLARLDEPGTTRDS